MSAKFPIRRADFDVQGFLAWIAEQGGEVGTPTNPYEVVRYRAYRQHSKKAETHIVYAKESGLLTWMAGTKEHYKNFLRAAPIDEQQPRKAKSGKTGSAKRARHKAISRASLLLRDGGDCWYCGKPMGEDCTIEHLVAKADGGRNTMSNYALAHQRCNLLAADKPLVEKMALRAKLRGQFA